MALLRVALVGCGLISESHIRAYRQHSDRARITICCDIDPQKAAQRAAQVGDARAVTSYEEVLADPDVDAVELCTPHHLHKDAVIAAARSGKHILCQKPLGRTIAECDAMIDAARQAGVILYYGEMNHTLPAVTAARQAIAAGQIGRLIGIQATYAHWQGGKYLSTRWRYDPALSGGGQLIDGGIHYISLIRNIGGPITAVMCFTAAFRPELGAEDTAVVSFRFRDGHLGSLFSSHAAGIWSPYPTLMAIGTEGMLAYGGPHGALTLHRNDRPDRRELLLEQKVDPFAVMIGRYLDTVRDGTENPSPGDVGREDLRVVLAAYASAQNGREVRLEGV
jgi:predicted dehydrogenase